jgi:AcrR family transcriptional regulator
MAPEVAAVAGKHRRFFWGEGLTNAGGVIYKVSTHLLTIMGRPTHITEDRILAAARKLFLASGMQATTAQVAEEAGISEGSIFKRYKTKIDLFKAAILQQHDDTWFSHLQDKAGKSSVQENLYEISLQAVGFFRHILPLMIMASSNPIISEFAKGNFGSNPPPVRALRELAAYFAAEMQIGRIRSQDPEIVARVFLGSINSYAFFEYILRSQNELSIAPDVYARGLVDFLWPSLDPQRQSNTTTSR